MTTTTQAVQRPILYSTPMVMGILEGRKTKTRRTKGLELINKNPDDWKFEWADHSLKLAWRFTQKSTVNEKSLAERNFHQEAIKCPYGKVGDILWVRETWFESLNLGYVYKATWDTSKLYYNPEFVKWKPSIFMPKEACRLFLRITDVRVERLQSISEEDAEREGVTIIPNARWRPFDSTEADWQPHSHKMAFESLWQSINGEDSWNNNPFVWVIEFERIEKPL